MLRSSFYAKCVIADLRQTITCDEPVDSQTCIYKLGVDFDRKRVQAINFPPPVFICTSKEKEGIVLNEEMLVLRGVVYF